MNRRPPARAGVARLDAALAALLLAAACGGPVATAEDPALVDVLAAPEQSDPPAEEPIRFERDGYDWTATPLASYVLRGIVVGRKAYGGWSADWRGSAAPYDVAVVWGDLARDGLHERLSWSMSGRWYYWRWSGSFPHGNDWISARSSNNHVVPATENVERAVAALDEGERVEMTGLLVRIDGRKGSFRCVWPSSLSRTDGGDASCEVFYVTRVRTNGLVHE